MENNLLILAEDIIVKTQYFNIIKAIFFKLRKTWRNIFLTSKLDKRTILIT